MTESLRRAFELRDRTSELERLIIEHFYYREVTGKRIAGSRPRNCDPDIRDPGRVE